MQCLQITKRTIEVIDFTCSQRTFLFFCSTRRSIPPLTFGQARNFTKLRIEYDFNNILLKQLDLIVVSELMRNISIVSSNSITKNSFHINSECLIYAQSKIHSKIDEFLLLCPPEIFFIKNSSLTLVEEQKTKILQ